MAGMSAGSVFVRLGAIFDDDAFDKFERRHVSASRAKDIKTRLGGDFDDRSFRQYEQHLSRVEAKAKRRDAFKASLGADYSPQAFRAYERDLAKAERETKQSTQRMRKAFAYGFGFLSAGGVYGAVSAVKSVTGAFGEAEVSSRKLQAQLRASGLSYREHAAEIDRVIQKTSKLAGLDDEDLQDAFTAIVRTTGSVTTAMKDMSLVADLARAKNMDVAKAGELVAKIHAGNVGPLKRLGIEFAASGENVAKLKAEYKNYTPEQLAVAKAADKQADSERALSVLRAKMKGQAVEYGKTQTGAAERAAVAWENLREKVGERLAPLFTRLANKTADFVNEMEEGTGQGGRFADRLEEAWAWLKRVGDRLKSGAKWLSEHEGLVKAAAGAWLGYRTALALAAGVAKLNAGVWPVPGKPGSAPTPGTGGSGPPVVVPGGGRGARAGRLGGAVAAGAIAGQLAGSATGNSRDGAIAGATTGAGIGSVFGAPGAGVGAAVGAGVGAITGESKNRKRMLDEERQAYENLARQVKVTRQEMSGLHDASYGFHTENRKALESMDTKKLTQFRAGLGNLRVTTEESKLELQRLGRAADEELGRRMRRVLDTTGDAWEAFGRKPKTTIHDVRVEVGRNSKRIANDLDTKSYEGRKAMSDNFKHAADAVRKQMDRAGKETKEGLAEIERLTRKSLSAWGLTPGQVTNYMRDSGKGSGNETGGMGRAGGGWIGQRGQAGQDTVPAMLGVGEAVLNRHQQAVVEGLLGDGFLDSLFANVTRPHYLASGGIVSVPGFPGERANRSILPMIAAVSRRFGLTLTDAYGQGHKSPGHTKTGTAADFAGPDKAMDAAVRWLVGRGYVVGYDGRFGSQAWPGHGPSYVAGGNAHLHVEFSSSGAGAPATIEDVKAPRTGLKGLLGRAVQGALVIGTEGANKLLSSAVSVPVAGGSGMGGANTATVRRWLAAGLRLAGQKPSPANINTLLGRVMQESGGDPRAINNWDSNAKAGTPSKGLLQTIDPTFNRYKVKGHDDIWNPVDNTAAAVRYMLARYGRLVGRSGSGYSGGGFVQRFSGGGKAKKPKIVPAAMLGSAPTQLSPRAMKGLERLQGPRIKRYEDWIGKATQADVEHDFLDRKFSLSEEEFILEDGSIDQGAIQQRVSELGQLRVKLADRLRALQKARKVAERIVDTYSTLVDRFSIARDALRGKRSAKRRSEYAAKVTKYSNDLSTWKSTLGEFDLGGQYSIDSAKLDITEIDRDIAGVLGTQPQASSGDGDSGGGDGGGSDTSTTPETPAATPPSAEEITAAAFQQVQAATQARQEMLNSFASNFTTAFAASRPGGVLSQSPDALALAAGARYIGATGDGDTGGAAGKTINIVNNYQQLPDDTATWSSQMRFSVEAGV